MTRRSTSAASVEYAPRGLVGALTPQANTTVEPEFAILWPAGVAMINARMMSAKPAMEDRLVDYFDQLDQSVKQFANAPVDAIAIACTGASYLVGVERERATVKRLEDATGVPVITAAHAVVAALQALGAQRIGLVSPYPASLMKACVPYWQAQGFGVTAVAQAEAETTQFHPIYAMPASGARTALDTLPADEIDAVIMLGTGMPTLRPILDKPKVGTTPVMSCMLCLAWRSVLALDGEAPTAASLLHWIGGADWGPRLAARRL